MLNCYGDSSSNNFFSDLHTNVNGGLHVTSTVVTYSFLFSISSELSAFVSLFSTVSHQLEESPSVLFEHGDNTLPFLFAWRQNISFTLKGSFAVDL